MASRRLLPVVITVCWSLLVLPDPGSSAVERSPLRTFALEDLFRHRDDFYYDRLTEKWISATEFMTNELFSWRVYNAATDSSVSLLTEAEISSLNGRTVTDISKDKTFLLLTGNRRKVFRFSSIADYTIYNLQNKTIQNLGQEPLQTVLLGPRRGLAYVLKNNVFYVPDAAQPDMAVALTTEGVPGQVYFGVADWIYEEEVFNSAEAMWFSPDGTHLAVASFNDTLVQSAHYPYYGNPFDSTNQYPQIVQFKYPKAGRTNPVAGLRVYNLNDLSTPPKIVAAPVDLVGLDHILGRVNWAADNSLVVLWLNRRQNVSVLTNCDFVNDSCRIVKEQMELNGWIDISDAYFDAAGTKMIEIQPLYHKENRFMHIAQLDYKSLTLEDLTPDNSTVTEILGWNQQSNTVYYIAAPIGLPWQRQVWASTAGVTRCVTCKEPSCHTVTASFAPGAAYGLMSCSAYNLPPSIFLYDTQTEKFKIMKNNADLKLTLSQYKLPMPLFNSLTVEDGVRANVRLLLPPNMEAGQKHPMIVKVYSGPGSSIVKDTYEFDYNMYLTTNRSFIVATIDVRGSSVLGVEALHAVNNALGTVEVTDTLATIRRLVKTFSFIDPDRVGVWGWSYGGFASTMMLIQDSHNTLACGAAVAPVTSWLYYDSIYTERYMGTPQANPAGYQRADLTLRAERLRGRRLLLVHGSGDDNVHYQNSMQLAKQLQHADIAFQQMTYTDESHSLTSVSPHFYHTLDRFWTDCFDS